VGTSDQLLLADAQTSGGLLVAVEPSRADALVAAMRAHETPIARVVGELTDASPGRIRVTRRRA
jgi:selenide,water dikinase